MNLKTVIKKILREQGEENVLEFPQQNMTVSVFRAEKKLVITPQDHHTLPTKIRTILLVLKQNFHVQKLKKLEGNSFEIIFDPREDFETVINFLKQQGANPIY